MSSVNQFPQRPGQAATPSSADDQSRLDDAMRRTDELLVKSLMRDEKRRKSRRVRILIGGSIMIATLALVSLFLLQSHNAPPQSAPTGPAAGGLSAANLSTNTGALVQQGWQLFQAHQFDAAAQKFQAATSANPNLTDAWNGLGWSEFNGGNSDDAMTDFKHAIKLQPNYPAALNGIGQIYFAKNDLANAEKYLLKAAPSASAAWWGLAKIYLLQSKWPDAEKYLQMIINSGEAQGSDLDQVKLMHDAAKNQNLPDSLKKEISPAYSNSPVAQTVQQAWAAMNHGDTVKARLLFNRALEDNPNDANALNGMGWLLVRTGDPDGALSRFQAALKADPDAAGSMNGIALIDRQRGKLDDAIVMWEQMQSKFPGVNAATYGLADAYMTKGQYDKAVRLYQQIVEASPTDSDAQAKLQAARKAADDNK